MASEFLPRKSAINELNKRGKLGIPFKCYADFLGENWRIGSPDDAGFQLEINHQPQIRRNRGSLKKSPISFKSFTEVFNSVQQEINLGNSFLTNLTFQTPIQSDLKMEEIHAKSVARYKLHVPDEFVVFSPETFVRIEEDFIYSNPMKGTIDANIRGAADLILNDDKETAEHVTIIDLIRNDLSRVANNVEVTNFRYLQELTTNHKKLLQVSSEIRGRLEKGWSSRLGDILAKLLPAGSISGAPKPETIRIIKERETYERGFYTGICGIFDGRHFDSGVMIRFIKKKGVDLFYCSGGGITARSDAMKEYHEMIDKIYFPF